MVLTVGCQRVIAARSVPLASIQVNGGAGVVCLLIFQAVCLLPDIAQDERVSLENYLQLHALTIRLTAICAALCISSIHQCGNCQWPLTAK